jgi:hypothetical protein
MNINTETISLHQKQHNFSKKLSRCALGISVGRPEHEGRKLAAAIKFVNQNFSYCDIIIGDTLQRHTLSMYHDLTNDESLALAEKSGIDWFKRNQEILNLLTINHDFLCWDEWLRDREYSKCERIILDQYNNNSTFKLSMDETIQFFLDRIKKNKHSNDEFDFKKAFSHCFNYLVEESVVMMLIWPKKQYHYIVYPHKIPQILDETHKLFVSPIDPELLNWLEIKFETRRKNSPLCIKTGAVYNGEEVIDDIKVSCVHY